MNTRMWRLIKKGIEDEMNDAQRDHDITKGRLKEASADYHFAMWLLSASSSKKPNSFDTPRDFASYIIGLIKSAPDIAKYKKASREKYIWLVKDKYKRTTGENFDIEG